MSSTHPVLAVVIALAAMSIGCRKEDPAPPTPTTVPTNTILLVEHHVDGAPLVYADIRYTNAAGHGFSVTRLEYYLSGLTLLGVDGTPDLTIAGPWYVNGTDANRFDLGTLAAGTFSGATMLLGLPPSLNLTGALPNTPENINMAWPVPMGGGYHFMKFEGHFTHNGSTSGYAMHIGRDQNLPHCAMPQPITLDGSTDELVLRFNLNEVFHDPHTYDLPTASSSMGSNALMALLRDNCANAFSIGHRP